MKRRAACGPFANVISVSCIDRGLARQRLLLSHALLNYLNRLLAGDRHIVLRFLMNIGVRSFTNERIIHMRIFLSQGLCTAPSVRTFPGHLWSTTLYTHAPDNNAMRPPEGNHS